MHTDPARERRDIRQVDLSEPDLIQPASSIGTFLLISMGNWRHVLPVPQRRLPYLNCSLSSHAFADHAEDFRRDLNHLKPAWALPGVRQAGLAIVDGGTAPPSTVGPVKEIQRVSGWTRSTTRRWRV
jgi:hypothetical protein